MRFYPSDTRYLNDYWSQNQPCYILLLSDQKSDDFHLTLFKSLKDNKLTTVITELFHELRSRTLYIID